MQVSKLSQLDILTSKKTTGYEKANGSKDFVAIFSEILVGEGASKAENVSSLKANSTDSPLMLDTSKGEKSINIDDYFTPQTGVSLLDIPLLLPSPRNIEALSDHASAKFQHLLKENNIPEAPSEITFDQYGEMQLPKGYPYIDELKQLFAENPVLERELSTVNALTSHYVGMQESIQFNEEYSKAKNQAEADLILQKYSHLFNGSQRSSNIALLFSADGEMNITADGKSLI